MTLVEGGPYLFCHFLFYLVLFLFNNSNDEVDNNNCRNTQTSRVLRSEYYIIVAWNVIQSHSADTFFAFLFFFSMFYLLTATMRSVERILARFFNYIYNSDRL